MSALGPIVIVSGITEARAFRRWFSRKSIRLLNGCGADVNAARIAADIRALAEVSVSQDCDVLAILDREERSRSAAELSRIVREHLPDELSRRTTVVFADTMIENWMLADIDSWKNNKDLRQNIRQKRYEGTDGLHEIRRLFKPRKHYQKTDHGIRFLKSVDEDVASENSDSFRAFWDVAKHCAAGNRA